MYRHLVRWPRSFATYFDDWVQIQKRQQARRTFEDGTRDETAWLALDHGLTRHILVSQAGKKGGALDAEPSEKLLPAKDGHEELLEHARAPEQPDTGRALRGRHQP